MSISGSALKVSVTAWNSSTNQPATGLVASTFTLEVCADGADISAITSSGNIVEDANGEYFVTLTAAQNTGTMMSVRGSNSTANVVVIPAKWNNLPASGMPETTNSGKLQFDSSNYVKSDPYQWNGAAIQNLPAHFSSLAIDAGGLVTFNNTTLATVTNLTNAPTAGDLTATMKASVTTAVLAHADSGFSAGQIGYDIANAGSAANPWVNTTFATAGSGSAGAALARILADAQVLAVAQVWGLKSGLLVTGITPASLANVTSELLNVTSIDGSGNPLLTSDDGLFLLSLNSGSGIATLTLSASPAQTWTFSYSGTNLCGLYLSSNINSYPNVTISLNAPAVDNQGRVTSANPAVQQTIQSTTNISNAL